MEFNRRLESFLELKNKLQRIPETEFQTVIHKAQINNPWFTEDNIKFAFQGIIHMLREDRLANWMRPYEVGKTACKKVGVIMAGNIPMVGFHDLLCVLLSGHQLLAKLSSQDEILLPFIAEKLIEVDGQWQQKISFVDKLKNADAVIATGSDNSSRYFEYYFRDLPKIIRKNRTSVAVLDGSEKDEELKNLGEDIYRYFGLGCRNVSKIYLPAYYDIVRLLDQLNGWSFLTDNHKYANNYTYNRAIYSMERISHLDNGFSLFAESDQLVSPTAVIYYQYYNDADELTTLLASQKEKIQCVVSQSGRFPQGVPFGKAQMPEVWEYADNVDTMAFLLKL